MRRVIIFLSLFLACLQTINSQHHDAAANPRSRVLVDLGKIDFPNSGPAEAQNHFIEGVLLLHSFEYSRARRALQEASRVAPNFALAYWGEAMTYFHPIWGHHDNASGTAVLQRLAASPEARRAKAPTEREKMYLDAVEVLFGSIEQKQIASAYSAAMAKLVDRFPDDLEAQAFYSLSLLGLTGTTRNTENYMKAAAVAETVYQKNPKHPGALHYLIHAYDDPVHAPLGLRAARVYGSVARGASHAQHMPSHIFFALGMWEDSIAANNASMKTARDEGVGGYHPLFWLVHAYLQLGRADEAAKLVSLVEEDLKKSGSTSARTHLASSRATYLVEARGEIPEAMLQPVDSSGIDSQTSFANHDLAIGLEYLRRKDIASAVRMLTSLRSKSTSMKALLPNASTASQYSNVAPSDIDTLSVMERILASSIHFASGNKNEAIQEMLSAAATEDKLIFEYGPPAIVKPAWEAAGEMLLSVGRKKEAADAFGNALKRYPNRKLSNDGLRAAGSP